MAKNTGIEWKNHTFNPWIGCTKVSAGCANCYAATLMQDRYHRVKWGKCAARSLTTTWSDPVRWNRIAAESGFRVWVFCASLADVFDAERPA